MLTSMCLGAQRFEAQHCMTQREAKLARGRFTGPIAS